MKLTQFATAAVIIQIVASIPIDLPLVQEQENSDKTVNQNDSNSTEKPTNSNSTEKPINSTTTDTQDKSNSTEKSTDSNNVTKNSTDSNAIEKLPDTAEKSKESDSTENSGNSNVTEESKETKSAKKLRSQKFDANMAGYIPLSDEDAALLDAWTPESKQDAWELSGQLEGDMIPDPPSVLRNVRRSEKRKWPNNEVPFEFSPEYKGEKKEHLTKLLIDQFNKTCVKPRPRTTDDKDYIYFDGNGRGCNSGIGYHGGKQTINLAIDRCNRKTIVHEVLHAIGFRHQHTVPSRDDYVEVFWDNIRKDHDHNFLKHSESEYTSFGEGYDFESLMHYRPYAFSVNGKPTILPKVVTGNSKSDGEIDEIRNALVSISDLYSKNPHLFRLFGSFNGKKDLLFKDSATGLVSLNQESPVQQKYSQLLAVINACEQHV